MRSTAPEYVELAVACRVLGISRQQSLHLCKLLGIKPEYRHDQWFLRRDSLDVLYGRLYPQQVA